MIRSVLALLLALVLGTVAAFAQTPCPRCGRIHATATATATSAGTYNVVALLNRQRAAWGRGLRPLRPDPVLQQVAERRANMMASRNLRGHPRGSFAPGRYEGVGWTSSQNPTGVRACYTYASHVSSCGAAMVRTSRGCFFAVVYR